MKKTIFYLLLCPVLAMGQESDNIINAVDSMQGIQFEHGLNWQQIREKAKAENKYIFMDVNASWCLPCKLMEKNIFSKSDVGDKVNPHYISVKVQMDTSKNDDEQIRKWYADARELKNSYTIKAYPTFLFFSPDGNIVHKAIGGLGDKEFIALMQDALKPNKQYYTLKERYDKGQKDTVLLRDLSNAARLVEDYEMLVQTSKLLINQMSEKEILEPANLKFVRSYTTRSDDRGFGLFYKNTNKVNKILNEPGNAEDLVEVIISKEEAEPFIDFKNKVEPDWNAISSRIEKKYNATFADRVVKWNRMRFCQVKKDWKGFCENSIAYIQKYGAFVNRFALNSIAWKIFLYSNDKKQLNAAAGWMRDKVIPFNEGPDLDTYANLLYKIGDLVQAIRWEDKALQMEPQNKDWLKTMEKMKKGQPTWPQD